MKEMIKALLRRLLSPGEIAALQAFRTERASASRHRSGLRLMHKRSLSRPETPAELPISFPEPYRTP